MNSPEIKDEDEENKKSKWSIVLKENTSRIIVIISLIILIIFCFMVEYFLQINTIDWGGLESLLGFVILSIVFKLDDYIKKVKEEVMDKEKIKIFVVFIFILIGFLGLWFSVRFFGLIIKNSLSQMQDSYDYTTSEIFRLLGYVLTANLSFNLANVFSKKELKPSELLNVLIQAIGIGLITLIPRYADRLLIDILSINNKFNAPINYVLILITLVLALVLLIWFKIKQVHETEHP